MPDGHYLNKFVHYITELLWTSLYDCYRSRSIENRIVKHRSCE